MRTTTIVHPTLSIQRAFRVCRSLGRPSDRELNPFCCGCCSRVHLALRVASDLLAVDILRAEIGAHLCEQHGVG